MGFEGIWIDDLFELYSFFFQYHPDVCKGSNCGVQFHRINEAYDVSCYEMLPSSFLFYSSCWACIIVQCHLVGEI